jgi:hypothetical protein
VSVFYHFEKGIVVDAINELIEENKIEIDKEKVLKLRA